MRLTLSLDDEASTTRFAGDIAVKLRLGDVVALHGGLGAGKTSFARALIRALAEDDALDVPSPTFTLVQTYAARLPVAHFDLYRLGTPDELDEIGLDDAVRDGVVLIEWPERAAGRLTADRLDITFDIAAPGRIATISAGSAWAERIERTIAIRRFLDGAGWEQAARRHLQGDASTRAYERVTAAAGNPTAVLMDAPGRVAEPGGYDAVAHRATEIRPFIAMGEALRAAGLSAPALLATERDAGLLLVEDLGRDGVVIDGAPDPTRYGVAVEALAALHAEPRPDRVPLPDGSIYSIPPFDEAAVAIEVQLLTTWFATDLGPTADSAFVAIWHGLFRRFDAAEKSWLLRDFHSPNLLWLGDREGVARIGLLDYQDAMIGASAYDVASLLQDVRVTVSPELEAALKAHYVELRRRAGTFDEAAFTEAYAISAAQRATKVMGGFARLVAWGKPQYIRHIPRLKTYLQRSLDHPILSDLARWYETYLPLDAR